MANPEESNGMLVSRFRLFMEDTVAAFIVAFFAAMVLGSLSAAGVITMALARLLLIVAWISGVVLVMIGTPRWHPSSRRKVVFSALLAIFLFGIERYEVANQPQQLNFCGYWQRATRTN